MISANELYQDNFQYVKKALVVQYPINIFPALLAKLLISPELSGLLVFGLQFILPQSHAIYTDCIKTFIQRFISK